MKPLLFAGCDDSYYKKYANPLRNSAEAHGMRCEIISGGKITPDEASVLRYRLLPDLLLKEPSVLVLDVDSIVNGPIEIKDNCDIGLFLRDANDIRKMVMGSAFYITAKARPFAVELNDRIGPSPKWFDDQIQIYRLYRKHLNDYKFKIFGTSFINWHCLPAPIWTGKGKVKHENAAYKAMQARYQ